MVCSKCHYWKSLPQNKERKYATYFLREKFQTYCRKKIDLEGAILKCELPKWGCTYFKPWLRKIKTKEVKL